MNIIFSVTEENIFRCAVAARSIRHHMRAGEEVAFHILHTADIPARDLEKLTHSLKPSSAVFRLIKSEEGIFPGVPVSQIALPPSGSPILLALPELFSDMDKALYLNTDILVCENLRNLYETDLQRLCMAGVEDRWSVARLRNLFLPDDAVYIDTGVVLLNLRRMRKLRLREAVLHIPDGTRAMLKTLPQDLVALLLQGEITCLDPAWNVMPYYTAHKDTVSSKRIRRAEKKPFLIHYAEDCKPWKPLKTHNARVITQCLRWFRFAEKMDDYPEEYARLKRRLRIRSVTRNLNSPLVKAKRVITKYWKSLARKKRKTSPVGGGVTVRLRDLLLAQNAEKRRAKNFFPEDMFRNFGQAVCLFENPFCYGLGGYRDLFAVLFNSPALGSDKSFPVMDGETFSVLHILRNGHIPATLLLAFCQSIFQDKPIYFVETSFINGIFGFLPDTSLPLKFRRLYSHLVDDMSFYFDSVTPSRVETYLNSPESVLDETATCRAAQAMEYIVHHRLTKYNFQPMVTPSVLEKPGKKVLVIDQAFNDASIWRGGANQNTFPAMLTAARAENPDATVFVKTHPDSVTRKKYCYYAELEETEQIIKLTEAANPYSILHYMDKVYVCTSQFGFEALMAGKKVVTFGIPVYAGWGLTDDRMICPRRERAHTLEELFHALYIRFAVHINPYAPERCELEVYLPNLVRLRDEYFAYVANGEKRFD